jgi:DNA-binding CsgD family transcriptional regulator
MVSFFGADPRYWNGFRAALDRWPGASTILSISAGTLADPARSTPEQLEQLDSAIAALALTSDPHEVSRVAVAAIWVDRLDGCRNALATVAHGGAGTVDGVAVARAQLMLAIGDFMSGQWQESADMTRRAHVHFETEPFPLLEWIAWHTDALLSAGRGDPDACAEACARMRQLSVPRGAGVVDRFVAQASGLCASGQGSFDEAFGLFASISPPGTFAADEPFALWVLMDLVEAAERSGRHHEAVAHVEAARAAGLARISSRLALLCAGAEAMIADDATAPAAFARALGCPGARVWAFDRARIELAFGEHLRRRRRTGPARAHLQAALESFDRIGAAPWARRARTELSATSRTRQRSPALDLVELTPQELEIAQLGATGLTNRQIGERLFISPRTVSAHLYRIFPKLGIGTRAGLRDALTGPSRVPDRGESG